MKMFVFFLFIEGSFRVRVMVLNGTFNSISVIS
jgi:hypothetical protein